MSSHSMLGAYGSWAAALAGEGPNYLSFRHTHWTDPAAWRPAARQRFRERVAMPDTGDSGECRIEREYEYDGLHVEELSWQLPYGPRTEALMLKPAGAHGPLPGVLALHDHGGHKFHGWQKITRTDDEQNAVNVDHQARAYGGAPWANRLAQRGYAVLAPDAFAFGSRRVRIADLPLAIRDGMDKAESEDPDYITAYNRWAGGHESTLAKSLLSAGTTWAGVWLAEDVHALDVLCARDDVDAERVGIGGLSGGGLRTVYLAGLDDRVRCAACVGMMTTWRDLLLNKSHTHTWMIYVPHLPAEMDYPDILGMRTPLPTLVQNNTEDPLFSLDEMRRADVMLRQVYEKADAAENYRCAFHAGEHKFDIAMQEEAFDWFDRWLAES